MSFELPFFRSILGEFTVATLCLFICSTLWVLGILPPEVAVWLTAGYLTILLLLSWQRFDGGSHPVFLFLGLLLVFQGGRLLGSVAGLIDDPFKIEVQTWIPFDVSRSTEGITLLILALSATLVYFPCRLLYRKVQLKPGNEVRLLPALYLFFALSAPFLAFKNIQYFRYIQAHGGYYAIYTDFDGVVGSAGTAVRLLALFGTQAFMLIYIIERRPKRLIFVTTLFLLLSVGDLLIGYRGKVFTLILTLWFIRNLKRGKHFPLPTLMAVGVLLSLVAVVIVGLREQHAVQYQNPLAFLVGQGISLNVTEAAVEFRHVFAPHGASYLLHDLDSAFVAVMEAKPGELFGQDLSVFLNPISYSWGAGTGSSYLAESYIAGGIAGVCIASVAIGLTFAWIQRLSGRFTGGILMVLLGQFLIYTPRTGLLEPISQGIKAGLPLCILLLMATVLSDRSRFIFATSTQAADSNASSWEGKSFDGPAR